MRVMDKTQFLIFEIGPGCNLGNQHPKCPNQHPDRFAALNTDHTLTPKTIVDLAVKMHADHNFQGCVGFHYYNEPMLYQTAMFSTMKALRRRVPTMKFVLWSNGTVPVKQQPHCLGWFDQIHVTDYGKGNDLFITQARQYNNHVKVGRWPLDNRLNMQGPERLDPCRRMFTEFIVDFHGNVHLCCYDWRGLGSPGNVFTNELGVLVDKWRSIRAAIAGRRMTAEAPEVCRRCLMRPTRALTRAQGYGVSDFVSGLRQRGIEEVEAIVAEGASPAARPAVVFVAYEGPRGSWRLRMRMYEHFSWNERLYEQERPRVYVVTDQKYDVPDYASCVVMPHADLPVVDGAPRFSLCKTKNLGIQRALDDGADLVICSDVDIVFPRQTWEAVLRVRNDEAMAPKYVMAPEYMGKHTSGPYDMGCTGTVAMRRESWGRIRYSESCIGYGADDGILLRDIQRAGLSLVRNCDIWHISHPGANGPRKAGHGSSDCWGRDSGFNFDNFAANRQKG